MLVETKGNEGLDKDTMSKTKDMVYDLISRHLEVEGNPSESNADFKEANINDLVYIIINPIISDFRRRTKRNIRLRREKEIIAADNMTGGYEEFVVMNLISVKE
ncbi:hypothetical protein BDZ91DRAFT_721991 [Kalaharituber pfeilii]|nr:hypothetical protein BDZ91DRAFT_721991 [Kalaharituber pfeilii]